MLSEKTVASKGDPIPTGPRPLEIHSLDILLFDISPSQESLPQSCNHDQIPQVVYNTYTHTHIPFVGIHLSTLPMVIPLSYWSSITANTSGCFVALYT